MMKLTGNFKKIGVAMLVVSALTTSIVASAATNEENVYAKSTSVTTGDGQKLNKAPASDTAPITIDEKTGEYKVSIDGDKTWTPYEAVTAAMSPMIKIAQRFGMH
ncbi:hypothetical protein SAMN03159341_13140 [Paenibacillus sp. 1_12]|uniref:hypothetical protein n=1 Tax=Paenibacillus sp. 1_12 TaxID=1566278 RepID=UPI0008E76515|nr:hypothetical protein [Paenibacillus sp. 1_12]SFM40924.1 hypothetical protein SAMN03159341_13140 [Paenibacillus sp. 1_12]